VSAVAEPRTAATQPAKPALRGWRRIPGLAWLCALAALLNAVAWGLIIPPFHVPDENAHVAYVQYLAETGKPPKHPYKGGFSAEENGALDAMAFYSVIGNPVQRVPSDAQERAKLATDERGHLSRVGASDAGSATNNPPLYYAAEVVPYELSPTGSFLLDRLVWMRILSAFMAAGTVLCVFLLCRELFPGTPWAWPFGALAAAFQPEFGFISGGVQVDNGLILCSAAFFLAVAWTLRRGLTPRRGVAIGLTLAAGLLVKTTMVAFVPAAVAARLIAAWRVRADRRASLGGIAGAALACAVPLAVFVLLSVAVWDRPIAGAAQTIVNAGTAQHLSPNLRENLVYAWELFLPRLPFMSHQFGSSFPPWDLWFTGLVGRFGWVDYAFPEWVSWVALPIFTIVVAAAIAGLVRMRAALRARLAELGVYALAIVGLAAVIAYAGYRYRLDNGPQARFEQARYLLPLLPLWGATVVLAVRTVGRRWGAALGGAVIMASVALTVFAQLLTIDRYYS
jgi:4-amino-4-deoxy-L-arabinose transferase-like glycosyltransferase